MSRNVETQLETVDDLVGEAVEVIPVRRLLLERRDQMVSQGGRLRHVASLKVSGPSPAGPRRIIALSGPGWPPNYLLHRAELPPGELLRFAGSVRRNKLPPVSTSTRVLVQDQALFVTRLNWREDATTFEPGELQGLRGILLAKLRRLQERLTALEARWLREDAAVWRKRR